MNWWYFAADLWIAGIAFLLAYDASAFTRVFKEFKRQFCWIARKVNR